MRCPARNRQPGRARGFTLTELAVVLAIVGLLLGSVMFTLSAQSDERARTDTQRRLEEAKELLLAWSLVHGRMPCPAVAATTGVESLAAGTAADGGTCTTTYGGFLPARTIGFEPTDDDGYGVDAWGNRIRYALSATSWGTGARFSKRHVASDATAAWSMGTEPADLVVCRVSPAVVTATSCDAGTAVTNQGIVAAVVFSTGKNGATGGGTGTNEARNLDNNALFVWRTPDPSDAAGGAFDDQMVWIPVGVLYSRLVSAGLLP